MPWLKSYVDFNNRMRQQSKTEVSRAFFKLMNNCVYGKFSENLRGRQTVHLLKDENLFRRRIAKSNFYSCIILSRDTALVRMERTRVLLDRPIYLTGIVLDYAKETMTDFWYRGITRAFQDPPRSSVVLNMTDTDSFIFTVTCPPGSEYVAEPWQRFASIAKYLDMSSYDDDHPLFRFNPDIREHLLSLRSTNAGVLGLFKDELKNGILKSLYCIKPKAYSIEVFSHHTLAQDSTPTFEMTKLKGISRSVVQNEISHDTFRTLLEDTLPRRNVIRVIRSHNHDLYIEEISKVSLTLFEDKRFWLDRFHSIPHGMSIPSNNLEINDSV